MRFLMLLCVFLMCSVAKASDLPKGFDRFMAAVATVESGGNDEAVGDDGRAIGRFQIWRAYWWDATHKPTSHGDVRTHPGVYEDVKDPAYARQVMVWYFTRYCHQALESGDWETLARYHHGVHAKDTRKYWLKVKAAMEDS